MCDARQRDSGVTQRVPHFTVARCVMVPSWLNYLRWL